MKNSVPRAAWPAVKNFFAWVSIISAFAFCVSLLARLGLRFIDYRGYSFMRQLTAVVIVALASLVSSMLVLSAPGMLRMALLLNRNLSPTNKRKKIGVTTLVVLVIAIVAAVWLHHKKATAIEFKESEVDIVGQYEKEQQSNKPTASNDIFERSAMPGAQASSAPIDEVRPRQKAPEVIWDAESKTPPAQVPANIAVLHNGYSIRFTHKQEIGSTTRLFSGTDYLDVSTAEIASFEREEVPLTAKASSPKDAASERPASYNSLPTGTRLQKDLGATGRGELGVENGTSEDAVVRLSLYGTGQTVRWFFVQAHSSAHIGEIQQGTYRLTYTTGLNWIEADDAFSWNPSYNEFERTIDFREESDSGGVKYHAITVTLNPVPSGNVRTKRITRDEFMKGHHHLAFQR
jgi:hypothetical protein